MCPVLLASAGRRTRSTCLAPQGVRIVLAVRRVPRGAYGPAPPGTAAPTTSRLRGALLLTLPIDPVLTSCQLFFTSCGLPVALDCKANPRVTGRGRANAGRAGCSLNTRSPRRICSRTRLPRSSSHHVPTLAAAALRGTEAEAHDVRHMSIGLLRHTATSSCPGLLQRTGAAYAL